MSNRLSRHEKQTVRRFIRRLAAKYGRSHKGSRGTVAGTRMLIRKANVEMGKKGRDALVLYPQDIGAGVVSVSQILLNHRMEAEQAA